MKRFQLARNPLIVTSILFCEIFCSTLAYSEKLRGETCEIYPPIFGQLKSTLITVDFPLAYKEALECLGRENNCAQSSIKKSGGSPAEQENFQREVQYQTGEFKKLSSNFPVELYPENLTALFKSAAEKSISVRDPNGMCRIPPPVLVEYSSELHKAANASNTLTITLRVKLEKRANENVAILAISYFRADQIGMDYPVTLPWLTGISFDLPPREIRSVLDGYFTSGFLRPGVSPIARP